MKLITKKNLSLLFILFLSFILRFYHYAQFPVAGETMDEFAWTFLGSSLIQEHRPISWSHFGQYQVIDTFYFQNAEFKMVSPVMDHPPLFSFIPGVVHLIKAGSWSLTPSVTAIRFPMVLLGVINLGLFYFLAKKFFKDKFLYLAVALYATIPAFIFASRLVVAENLLVSWLLITLILLNSKLTKNSYHLLAVVSGLAVLTKVSGIIIPLIILTFALSEKNRSLFISSMVGMVTGWLIFAFYGFVFDWHLFTSLIFSQSSRDIGFSTLINRMFLHPGVVEKIMVDGWLSLGLLSLVLLFIEKKKNLSLQLSTIIIIGFTILFVGESTFHGWYDYLLYPIMAISLVQLIKLVLKKENYLLFAFAWLFLLANFRELFTHLSLPYLSWVRPLSLVSALPFLIGLWSNQWAKRVIWLLISVLIIINIILVFNYQTDIYWENDLFFNPIRVN